MKGILLLALIVFWASIVDAQDLEQFNPDLTPKKQTQPSQSQVDDPVRQPQAPTPGNSGAHDLAVNSKLEKEMETIRRRLATNVGTIGILQKSDTAQTNQLKGVRTNLSLLLKWQQELTSKNGNLWWLAAKKGSIQEAIDITPEAKSFFKAAVEANFKDSEGKFDADAFVSAITGLQEEMGKKADQTEVDNKASTADLNDKVSISLFRWIVGLLVLVVVGLIIAVVRLFRTKKDK